jgi:hypothetical protein
VGLIVWRSLVVMSSAVGRRIEIIQSGTNHVVGSIAIAAFRVTLNAPSSAGGKVTVDGIERNDFRRRLDGANASRRPQSLMSPT